MHTSYLFRETLCSRVKKAIKNLNAPRVASRFIKGSNEKLSLNLFIYFLLKRAISYFIFVYPAKRAHVWVIAYFFYTYIFANTFV